MTVTKINGQEYDVVVPFDVHYTSANDLPVIRRQEPVLRRCACCDKCMHVERHHEEVYSFEEAIQRGWLTAIERKR